MSCNGKKIVRYQVGKIIFDVAKDYANDRLANNQVFDQNQFSLARYFIKVW